MGLFSGESREEKQAKKKTETLAKLGLENINEKDYESVKDIVTDLSASSWFEASMLVSPGTSSEDLAKVSYLNAIVNQNWIMIRQLDRIQRLLENKE